MTAPCDLCARHPAVATIAAQSHKDLAIVAGLNYHVCTYCLEDIQDLVQLLQRSGKALNTEPNHNAPQAP